MLEGIDTSSWQGKISWAKVKASGITFAFIKATEGIKYVNPRFKHDWAETKSQGIVRGAYHFFDPTQPAALQAKHFLSTLQAAGAGDLPAVLDLEGNKWTPIAPHQRMEMVLTWLRMVEEELGTKPILYLGFYFARDVLQSAKYPELSSYPLWIAHYTSKPNPLIPPPWSKWTFWQFSDKGQIPGVSGNVDVNRFRGAPGDLVALSKPKA